MWRTPGATRRTGTRSFFAALFYISFLPEVMSGPLTRFSDFASRLDERRRSWTDAAEGLRRFALGLAKKLILSGAMAAAADAAYGAGAAMDARVAWLGAVAYTLQLYFDFSGYSDMACGLGRALGFKCAENFDHPYAAVSITDSGALAHLALALVQGLHLHPPRRLAAGEMAHGGQQGRLSSSSAASGTGRT